MGLVTLEPGAHTKWRTPTSGQTLIGTADCGWALGLVPARVGLSLVSSVVALELANHRGNARPA